MKKVLLAFASLALLAFPSAVSAYAEPPTHEEIEVRSDVIGAREKAAILAEHKAFLRVYNAAPRELQSQVGATLNTFSFAKVQLDVAIKRKNREAFERQSSLIRSAIERMCLTIVCPVKQG